MLLFGMQEWGPQKEVLSEARRVASCGGTVPGTATSPPAEGQP